MPALSPPGSHRHFWFFPSSPGSPLLWLRGGLWLWLWLWLWPGNGLRYRLDSRFGVRWEGTHGSFIARRMMPCVCVRYLLLHNSRKFMSSRRSCLRHLLAWIVLDASHVVDLSSYSSLLVWIGHERARREHVSRDHLDERTGMVIRDRRDPSCSQFIILHLPLKDCSRPLSFLTRRGMLASPSRRESIDLSHTL